MWVKIYDELLNRILSGSLSERDRCPSIEDTARQWGVSRLTAAKAYRNLAEDGYLRRYPGPYGYLVVFSA
jgi:GntR family histidine utilization transcriptional repressor